VKNKMNFCNVFNGKKSIRIVLSDAGDILFDSASSINRQKEILTELFNRNGMNYSIDDVCNMLPRSLVSKPICFITPHCWLF